MCGINGIFAYGNRAPVVDPKELDRTRDAMSARGPDGYGAWYSQSRHTGLGHRRLSIIELSELGAQPMSTEDGRLHVVFNGEIYNYESLRRELTDAGVALRSHSDTEVLLHLYRRDGYKMVKKLRGMFAFAIWDEDNHQLFLARDPYGIKPLYYADDGLTFRFASQVKALRAGGAVSGDIDPGGMVGFFLWGSVPEPLTLYRNIRALPAGCFLKVTGRGADTVRHYWDISETIASSINYASSIPLGSERAFFREALSGSVRAHLVADVPVGAFLSAGLDSTSIVGLATEIAGRPVETITFTCDEFKGKPTDELPLAQLAAAHFRSNHHVVTVEMSDMEADLLAFINAMDQPTIDGVNTWFVAKAAAQKGLKVVLSGLGGDELLGGYRSFSEVPRRVRHMRIPSRIPVLPELFKAGCTALSYVIPSITAKNGALLSLGGTYEGAYQIQRGVLMPWELESVLDRDFANTGLQQLAQAEAENCTSTSFQLEGFAKMVELESTRYMRNQLLRDTDWAGMAHSLEIRVPLVDSVLIEQVVGLAVLGRLGEGKTILPQSLAQSLPQPLLERPKTGFTVPIWKWLRHSEAVDSWKRVKALRKPHTHDYCRWAFSIASQFPETKDVLR